MKNNFILYMVINYGIILLVRMKIGILSVMACYIVMDSMDEDTKYEFWNQLNDILNTCHGGERVIVPRDWAGWLDVKRNGVDGMFGCFGNHRINENEG
jgi:hypothetical protein